MNAMLNCCEKLLFLRNVLLRGLIVTTRKFVSLTLHLYLCIICRPTCFETVSPLLYPRILCRYYCNPISIIDIGADCTMHISD